MVREGGSVDLECMVSNTSFIRFYWQLDGETVDNSSRRFQRGSDLHITRVDRRLDGGHFTCIAMNVTTGFSLTSLAASLNIQCEYTDWVPLTSQLTVRPRSTFCVSTEYTDASYAFSTISSFIMFAEAAT